MSEIPRESIERAELELNTLTAGMDADNQRYVATMGQGPTPSPCCSRSAAPLHARSAPARDRDAGPDAPLTTGTGEMTTNQPDMVAHPPHYTQGEIECIDAIRAALGPAGFAAYCRGNAMKYVWRAGLKGDAVTDLRKAEWYLNCLTEAER